MSSGLDVVNISQTQIGFIEGPNNENPYGTWYGIPNESYCAMGVSWVFNQAGLSSLVAAQTPKGFSLCPAGLTWFQKKGRVVDKYAGQPGDLVFYSWSGNGVADHVEIVENASRDGLTCIGFNTGPDKSTGNPANGDGVFRVHRPYLYVLAIVRPEYPGAVKPASSKGNGSKVLATGVAGATALGGAGAVGVTHSTTPANTSKTTVLVAPPFPGSAAFKIGAKGTSELIVARALAKAGLLPMNLVSNVLTAEEMALIPVYQSKYPGLRADRLKHIVGPNTYLSMAAKAGY